MNRKIGIFIVVGMIAGLVALPAGAGPRSHGPAGHDGYLLAGSGSLVVTGSPAPAASQAAQTGNPELVVNEPMFNFGRVMDGTEVEHEFLIENRGDGDLAIDQILTG